MIAKTKIKLIRVVIVRQFTGFYTAHTIVKINVSLDNKPIHLRPKQQTDQSARNIKRTNQEHNTKSVALLQRIKNISPKNADYTYSIQNTLSGNPTRTKTQQ